MRLINMIIVSILMTSSSLIFSAERPSNWDMILHSKIILEGVVLGVPSSRGEKNGMVSVRVVSQIKGPATKKIIYIRANDIYMKSQSDEAKLLLKKDEHVILFLDNVGTSKQLVYHRLYCGNGYYFSDATTHIVTDPIISYSKNALCEITHEIDRQNTSVYTYFSSLKIDNEAELHKLINEFVNRSSWHGAYVKILNMGTKAVPALIKLMCDNRDLPDGIVVSVESKMFDDYKMRHWRPKKVIDLISIILHQITGQAFEGIVNGGTESQRNAECFSWKLWLSDNNLNPKAKT